VKAHICTSVQIRFNRPFPRSLLSTIPESFHERVHFLWWWISGRLCKVRQDGIWVLLQHISCNLVSAAGISKTAFLAIRPNKRHSFTESRLYDLLLLSCCLKLGHSFKVGMRNKILDVYHFLRCVFSSMCKNLDWMIWTVTEFFETMTKGNADPNTHPTPTFFFGMDHVDFFSDVSDRIFFNPVQFKEIRSETSRSVFFPGLKRGVSGTAVFMQRSALFLWYWREHTRFCSNKHTRFYDQTTISLSPAFTSA
jgi:hypothetical protein